MYFEFDTQAEFFDLDSFQSAFSPDCLWVVKLLPESFDQFPHSIQVGVLDSSPSYLTCGHERSFILRGKRFFALQINAMCDQFREKSITMTAYINKDAPPDEILTGSKIPLRLHKATDTEITRFKNVISKCPAFLQQSRASML